MKGRREIVEIFGIKNLFTFLLNTLTAASHNTNISAYNSTKGKYICTVGTI